MPAARLPASRLSVSRLAASRRPAALAALALWCAVCVVPASAQESKPALNGNLSPAAPLLDLQTGFEKLADKVGPSVVTISTMKRVAAPGPEVVPGRKGRKEDGDAPPRERMAASAGSGVIISADGLVLTNQHVVEDAVEIEVATPARRRYPARVVGVDPRSDLAVLKIDGKDLPAAALGDASKVRVGHWAVAMGNPFGIAHDGKASLSVGVVSALGRFLGGRPGGDDRYYGNLIQTDASINPGNSGGPLLNVHGEVIGINTVISTRSGGSEGVGFAVPINEQTRGIIATLSRGEEVAYGYLGVQIKTPDEKECRAAGVEIGYGALVDECVPGGPGDKAGLRPGDVVVSYRGERILDSDHLVRLVGATPVGQKAEVVLHRGGKPVTLSIETTKRPTSLASGGGRLELEEWRGLAVREMTPLDRRRLQLPRGTAGVIVERIKPASPAAGAKPVSGDKTLGFGDLITRIGDTPIKNVSDFREAVRAAKGSVILGVEGKGEIAITE